MANTNQAMIRAQQRGIPPLIDQLLDLYGHEEYDDRGGIVLHFDRVSRRRMERDLGREPLRCLAEWHDAYKVKSSRDGATITFGRRFRKLWRK